MSLKKVGFLEKPDNPDEVPIDHIVKWFDKRIPSPSGNIQFPPTKPSDKVLVLKSGTGSGKSTLIAPTLYEHFVKKERRIKGTIAVTQPRVLTAMDIPKGVVNMNSEFKLGENIGWQTKDFVKNPIQKQGILYMTAGVLLQHLKTLDSSRFIHKYGVILIDEVHERSVDIDSVIYFLREFLKKHFKQTYCPFVVLMSATFDDVAIAKYFDPKINPAMIIRVKGAPTHPIESHHTDTVVGNVYEKTVDVVSNYLDKFDFDSKKCVFKTMPKDVIVFCPTQSVIAKLDEQVVYSEKLSKFRSLLAVVTVTSPDVKHVSKSFMKLRSDKVKIILATNVAETGITFPNLGVVIDLGYHNTVTFNPLYGYPQIQLAPITQNMAIQRKGRVGRKSPGIWYPLYTESAFKHLQVDEYPAIVREDISGLVLDVLPNFTKLTDMIQPPSFDSVKFSLNKLFVLGYCRADLEPTELGQIASTCRHLTLETLRMVLCGYVFSVDIQSLVRAAAIITTNPLTKPTKLLYRDFLDCDVRKVSDNYCKLKSKLFVADSILDRVFFLSEIEQMLETKSFNKVKNHCDEFGVDIYSVFEVIEKKIGIEKELSNHGFDPYANKDTGDMLLSLSSHPLEAVQVVSDFKRCVYEGFKFRNLVKRTQEGFEIVGLGQSVTPKPYLPKVLSNLPIVEYGKKFEQLHPCVFINTNISIESDGSFTMSGLVSVLDGFVNYDDTFTIS